MTTYRVDPRQPQNVYRDEQYIGVMFTAEDAALIVEALNEVEREHGPALPIAIPTREGCGPDQLHPTCADVSALDEQPGSAWICTSACRQPADSCTCSPFSRSGFNPDPACPVHQGRRARGPKPPPLGPGCICDGSGRTCPRHGAVM